MNQERVLLFCTDLYLTFGGVCVISCMKSYKIFYITENKIRRKTIKNNLYIKAI